MTLFRARTIFYIPGGDEEYEIILRQEEIPYLEEFIQFYYKSSAENLYSTYTSGCRDEIDSSLNLEWMEEILEEGEEGNWGHEEILSKIIEWYFCAVQAIELTEEEINLLRSR